ncbi:MAG: hypothetical protein EI684_00150 [Candidatus Viridilinea halotolerans]|uniref:Uncharacterized protein n=1 Tax=Candidatus Viridilinea halotolerans TaxID=2491704 RepID=A0A426UCL4_9CHLR|nr:MAG: hypothetical protein EI684_00150 [Candidatus Viridilinea halotolerans]
MDANKSQGSSISQATTLEAMGTFWDTHDFADYDTDAPDIPLNIARSVQLEADLWAALESQAHVRGVSLETLVNLWLQQKLNEAAQPTAGS